VLTCRHSSVLEVTGVYPDGWDRENADMAYTTLRYWNAINHPTGALPVVVTAPTLQSVQEVNCAGMGLPGCEEVDAGHEPTWGVYLVVRVLAIANQFSVYWCHHTHMVCTNT